MNAAFTSWQAELALQFSRPTAQRSVLSRRHHQGPLLIQKALYPEGPSICHVTLLHPPSGIAGGDELHIDIQLHEGAHAVLANTGATRWYKANGQRASQHIHLQAASQSTLEWLPCENLLFEQANAYSTTHLHLTSGARSIGWEYFQLGSVLQDGNWLEGQFYSQLEVHIDGQLFWLDQADFDAQDPIRFSSNGLHHFPMHGTLWAYGPPLSADDYEQFAQSLPWKAVLQAGVTQLVVDPQQSLYVVRVLANHAEDVKALFIQLWRWLRPRILNTPAQDLRLWAT